MAGKASKQSDVYSYGVVTLEFACRQKPIEPKTGEGKVNLVEWVWDLYGTGQLLEACDPRLKGELTKQEMEQLMIVGLYVHTRTRIRGRRYSKRFISYSGSTSSAQFTSSSSSSASSSLLLPPRD
ncbi:hypothetical protein F3Y22_tig00109925pilonHSYRG00090 [Hibiscus syriacus]|uniref:Serine-threonine/tyrosine-protein kinase catalytic domain-containing protein n=1 Tax=Hibiscus syriacus TaxID=106335 RepID=A0A6A3BSH9_HIBSY|nr:hypothetical protein F3Y22_tig00109925pilonHSYRG00090 [Hibiscus syriacus]